jgi:hypothetical protein
VLSADWSDTDIAAYVDFCDQVEISDVSVPMQVWSSESDNKSAAHNLGGDASGIFQLMPATAKEIGYDTSLDPHLDHFRQLGVAGQMPWAAKFYAPHRGQVGTVARFYLCTFLPALLSCADDPTHVVAGKEGPLAWAYAGNAHAFDPQGTGVITVQSLVDRARRTTGPRTVELIGRAVEYKRGRDTDS